MPTRAGIAASVVVAPLLDGPRQTLEVVHRSRLAWQLADSSGTVVCCVMTADSIRLPHGVVVPSIPGGTSLVSVGDGSLGWDGTQLPITRWWSPRRPALPALRPHLSEPAVRAFACTWADGIGSGDGLTPYADDVVCGALVALHAAGHPGSARLADEVRSADLERRTTATSAALLRLAANGYCIDPLADYVSALAVGRGTRPAAERLTAVGHSSGRGLIEGVAQLLPGLATTVAA